MSTTLEKKPCDQCGRLWQPKNAWTAKVGRFCSKDCRMQYHRECRELGKSLREEG